VASHPKVEARPQVLASLALAGVEEDVIRRQLILPSAQRNDRMSWLWVVAAIVVNQKGKNQLQALTTLHALEAA